MVQIRESCQYAGSRATRSCLVRNDSRCGRVHLARASSAKSGALDRLLPKDQPFVPYLTT